MATPTPPPPPPPPPPAPSPGQVVSTDTPKKNWVVNLPAEAHSIDLADGTFPASPTLSGIDWTSTVAVSRATTGSQQTMFARVAQGVLVIKASRDAAQEYYSFQLAKLLGVKVPECRIVIRDSPEYISMLDAISKVASKTDLSYLETAFGQGEVVLLSEFLPDTGCLHITDKGALDLGRLAVYDCVVMNLDRFTFFGLESGNLCNLLISKDGSVFGIDQGVRPLFGSREIKVVVMGLDLAENGEQCMLVNLLLAQFSKAGGSFPEGARSILYRGMMDVVGRARELEIQDLEQLTQTVLLAGPALAQAAESATAEDSDWVKAVSLLDGKNVFARLLAMAGKAPKPTSRQLALLKQAEDKERATWDKVFQKEGKSI